MEQSLINATWGLVCATSGLAFFTLVLAMFEWIRFNGERRQRRAAKLEMLLEIVTAVRQFPFQDFRLSLLRTDSRREEISTLIRRLEINIHDVKDTDTQQSIREIKSRFDSILSDKMLPVDVAETEQTRFITVQQRLGWEVTRWEDELRVIQSKIGQLWKPTK